MVVDGAETRPGDDNQWVVVAEVNDHEEFLR